jgi:hypothetical protein
MPTNQLTADEVADRVRVAVQHYCQNLGLSLNQFAEGARMNPLRLQHFMQGTLWLDNAEWSSLGDLLPDLQAGEDRDAYDARISGKTPRKSLRDLLTT